MTLLETAHLLRGTYQTACIPVGPEKAALWKWGKYITSLPSDSELNHWFTDGESIAIVAGKIQCLDVDIKYATPELWTQFLDRLDEAGLTPLIERLVIQTTRSHGYHMLFRCPAELRNVKLASAHSGKPILETRGTGGYFLVDPSPGYKVIQGSLDAIPEITRDERDDLFAIATTFDAKPKLRDAGPAAAEPRADGELSPGDDFDARANVPALLEGHGWTQVDQDGHHWRRPGKDKGISASWDIVPGRFWCWSTSTPFESSKGYRPWHVFAVLECGGDFHEAARTLGKMGYGSPARATGTAKAAESPPADGAAKATPAPLVLPPPIPWNLVDQPPDLANCLLGDRFLERGSGLIIFGPAGVGKSTACLQLCAEASAGLDPFNIHPIRPLRIVIIQTEDSLDDMREAFRGILNSTIWDADRLAAMQRNLVILPPVAGGDPFKLQRLIHAACDTHNPDIVAVNPLLAFCPDDPTRDLGKLLYQYVDPVIKERRIGFIAFHHTPKTFNRDTSNFGQYDFQYLAAGDARIANWPRAMLSIEPLPDGIFRFRCVKRWRKIGWTWDGKPTSERFYRYAKVGIRWEDATKEDVKKAEQVEDSLQILTVLPACDQDPISREMVVKRARETIKLSGQAIGVNKASTWLNLAVQEGAVERIKGRSSTNCRWEFRRAQLTPQTP